ncbi:flagellar basal body-associated protein FliL [Cohaesibacter sp. CAU 1516]|uniref:flagellar basal body-associated FliL family protein n=1 Tax=Cohaesibacter sp. CAU 1516 TaxID=2576038 RepID=UPI0010FDEAA2|nr:flagellar basal body-associated FliL family protein [Cohaesibacter sp. CAU 1516]TLP48534.1 flagellar basal body-associated protein FliL [Cohaesibacter sp. CAU 1516]
MADEVEIDEEGAEGKGSGGKKKLIIIIALALVLLLGGGGAAYYFLMMSSDEVVEPENDPNAEPEAKAYFYDLPEMTVNLNSKSRRAQYLRIKVSLEMNSQEQARRIEPFMPRVLDAFQVYLRELRTSDLEGSAGLFRLKRELLKRINDAIYPVKVNDILFKEILIQ